MRNYRTLFTNPSIHIYINRLNNRLFFRIKDGYKLYIQTPETMKLFDSTKTILYKVTNCRNVLILEVIEVVLVQFSK